MSEPHRLVEYYGGPGRLVRFVPQAGPAGPGAPGGASPPGSPAAPGGATGPEIRHFYEELVSQPSSAKRDFKPKPRKRKSTSSCQQKTTKLDVNDPRLKNRLLKSAQENNLKDVKACLEMGVDVNCKDEYDWTALMCAAHSGANDVIGYLLSRNCDTEMVDSTGRTAAGIALIAGRTGTYDLIERGLPVRVKPEPEDVLYCGECGKTVTGDRETHEASLGHQVSTNPASVSRRTVYQLPETNRGYQMMLRTGWRDEGGLGPHGQGPLYPVPTVLRKDRACLGTCRKLRARITHSTHDIQNKPAATRETRKHNKTKGKEWERAMRAYMN